METNNSSTLPTVLAYARAGLCVLPADVRAKRPTLSSFKQFRQSPPTPTQLKTWFTSHDSVCILSGAASGHVEILDFDQAGKAFEPWSEVVAANKTDLLDRLVVQQTQSGGRHVIYRCESMVPGNKVLARSQSVDNAPPPVLIETRGEGGLFLCDPTPGYRLQQGDLTELPVITESERKSLIEAAMSLHEGQPINPSHSPADAIPIGDGGMLPGDDFNQRGDIRPILQRHGWRQIRAGENEQWCRPRKTEGCSATLKDRVFYVFTSNAPPFEPNQGYAPFAVYAMLEHSGDFAAAAIALREEGYGGSDDGDVDLSGFKVSASATASPAEPDTTTRTDPGAVPEKLFRIPGFVSELMDHCLDTAPYPNQTLAFCGAIALLATLAGRKVRDPGDNRTNLYLLGLAHSAAGKDWPRKLNTRILHQVGLSECLGERFASGEGIQDALFLTPSMLFQTDEIDGMLQSMNKSKDGRHENVMSTLLTMYSSANSVYPMRRKAGKESPGAIDQPSLVIFGTAIPNHYYEALSERMLTNGFFARMMILECGQRGRGQEPKIRDVPQRIMETAEWWADYRPGGGNLGLWHPVPAVVEHDDDARELLIQARCEAETEYTKSEQANDSVGTTVWGRVNEQTRKLALIYAISVNCRSPVIDREAARWAIDLVNHLTRRMLFMASSHVSESDFDHRCQLVLDSLRKWRDAHDDEWMMYRDLSRKHRWPRPDHDMIRQSLVDRELIEIECQPTGGRPRIVYRLTPTCSEAPKA